MAASDARPVPRKNAAFRLYFAIRKSDGTLITTWTGADSEVSLDGAAFADCTNEATEIGTSGCGYIDFTASEMNADAVVYKLTVTNTGALTLVITLFPEEVGDYRVNVEQFGGTAGTFSGGRPEVNVSHWGGTAIATATVRADLINIAGSAVNTSSAQLGVNVVNAGGTAWGSGAITAASIASNAIAAAKIASGAITSAKFAADAIDSSALAASAVTEIQSGLATSAALTTVDTNVSATLAAVDTEIAAIITHLTDIKGATFNGATDSLESIRDRGDTAWVTATGFSTLTQADIRTAVGLASANLDTQLADLPTVAEFEARTIVAANYSTLTQADIRTAVGLASANLDTQLADLPTVAEFEARTLVAANYSTVTTAQVNAEVVDALATDTYAEPGGVPAATSSLKDKLCWVFTCARNKYTETATTQTLRNDADNASLATATVSDDGTTFTRGEWA